MKNTLRLAVTTILAFCLGMPVALCDKKSSNEKVTVVVEISEIKQVEASHINVKLAPMDGTSKAQSKRPKISFKDCKKAGSKCGQAIVSFNKVEPGVKHKLTVCHTRRSGNDCPTGNKGQTREAGEIRFVTPSKTKSRYTVNLGGEY